MSTASDYGKKYGQQLSKQTKEDAAGNADKKLQEWIKQYNVTDVKKAITSGAEMQRYVAENNIKPEAKVTSTAENVKTNKTTEPSKSVSTSGIIKLPSFYETAEPTKKPISTFQTTSSNPLDVNNVNPGTWPEREHTVNTAGNQTSRSLKSATDLDAPAEQKEKLPLFKAIGKAASGGTEQYAGGLVGSQRFAYEAGQNARNAYNDTLKESADREIVNAQAELDGILAGTIPGTEADIQALRNIIEYQTRLSKAYGTAPKAQSEATEATHQLANDLTQSGQEKIEASQAGRGTYGKLFMGAVSQIPQIAADAVAAGATSKIGGLTVEAARKAMPALVARSFGGAATEAKNSGANLLQQTAAGSATAAVEWATEMISNIALPMKAAYGSGLRIGSKTVDEVIESAIEAASGKIAKSPILRKLVKSGLTITAAGASEALEEAIAGVAEWPIPAIYGDELATAKEMLTETLYSMGVAAISGSLGASTNVAGIMLGKDGTVQTETVPETVQHTPPTSPVQTQEQAPAQPSADDYVASVLSGKQPSNSQIDAIYEDDAAKARLQEAGIELPTNKSKSEFREAVKGAAQLIAQNNAEMQQQAASEDDLRLSRNTQRQGVEDFDWNEDFDWDIGRDSDSISPNSNAEDSTLHLPRTKESQQTVQNAEKPLVLPNVEDYTVGNTETKEDTSNVETAGQRNDGGSSERNGLLGASSGQQAGRMVSGTEEAQGIRGGGETQESSLRRTQRESGENQSKAQSSGTGRNGKVSAQELIPEADSHQIVEIDNDDTPDNRAVNDYAALHGIEVVKYKGDINLRNGEKARGFHNRRTGKIGVSTTNKKAKGIKLTKHEFMHQKVDSGEVIDTVLNRAKEKIDPELIDYFVKFYESGGLDAEELICDAAGLINQIQDNIDAGESDVSMQDTANALQDVLKAIHTSENELYNNDFSDEQPSDNGLKLPTGDEKAINYGDSGTAYTEDNKKIQYKWAVVPVSDLVVSHDSTGITNEAYPQELQPRDRSRASSVQQIQKIANDLNPEKLGRSVEAQNGAPFVRDDGVVVGGNARSAAIAKAYASGKANAYRQYIIDNAESFGVTGKIPTKPVLVRVVQGETNWSQLAKELNVSTLSSKSSVEAAENDAQNIGDIVSLITPNDEGDINTKDNLEFIQVFVNTIPSNERASMMTSDGLLSQEGVRRAENAVFAYAYKDKGLLKRIAESTDNDIRNITNAMVQVAQSAAAVEGGIADGTLYDIPAVKTLTEAVNEYIKAKQEGKTIAEMVGQTSFFNETEQNVLRLAQFIEQNKRNSKQLRTYFGMMFDAVAEYGDPNQTSFETVEPSIEDVIGSAGRKYIEETGKGFPRIGDTQFSREMNDKFIEQAIEINDNGIKTKSGKIKSKGRRVSAVVLESAALNMKHVKKLLEAKGTVEFLPDDIMGDTFVSDSSYGGSEEVQTVCIRSLTADALLDAVAKLLERPLTIKEQIAVSQNIFELTDQPECLYCYVAMDRKAYREFLGSYYDVMFKASSDMRNGISLEDAILKHMPRKYTTSEMKYRFKLWNSIPEGERITAADLSSIQDLSEELDSLRSEILDHARASGITGKELTITTHVAIDGPSITDSKAKSKSPDKVKVTLFDWINDPAIGKDVTRYLQLYDAAKYAQSASWAKKRTKFMSYDGHILRWSQDRINKLNQHYGLRLYSFIDFSPAFILENMQMVLHASVRGLKGLAYTKELDFVRIFAPTGMNINISVFGFTNSLKSYRDSDYCSCDGMQGADWYQAKKLRDQYDNVGITFVAISDEQVRWALRQDWIDVVIPFHMVRTGAKIAEHFNWDNFTSMTSDVKDTGWKAENDASSISPPVHQNNLETYLAALKDNHLKPRFEKFLNDPETKPYYMKLVNETRQSDSQTQALQPNFGMDAVDSSIAKISKWRNYYQPIFSDDVVQQEYAEEIAESIRSGKPYDKIAGTYSDRSKGTTENKLSRELLPSAVENEELAKFVREYQRKNKPKVSKVRSNTYEIGGLYNEVEAQMDGNRLEDFKYDPISEKQSMQRALRRLNKGIDEEAQKLRDTDAWGSEDLDTAMGVLYNYRQDARMTGDYSKTTEWSHVIANKGTKGGQFIQAFAKYSRTATGAAAKAAAEMQQKLALNPKQEAKVTEIAKATEDIIKEGKAEPAESAVQASKNGKEAKKTKGKRSNSQMAKDAVHIIREIYDAFANEEKRKSHGVPVEQWTKVSGQKVAEKLDARTNPPKTKSQTVMQTIIEDIVKFAEEHALPERQKSPERRTALMRITDYLNNREAYQEAWQSAKDTLRAMYADDAEKLELFEAFLQGTIGYNADEGHFDKVMFNAIMETADGLGIDTSKILDYNAVGVNYVTVNKITNAFVNAVNTEIGDTDYTAMLSDAVKRHVTNVINDASQSERIRLERLINEADKELDIKLTKLLTESKLSKADAAGRVASYLINDLGISQGDAAIASDVIAQHYMAMIADRSEERLRKMFAEKANATSKQTDKLIELFRLGGFENTKVRDAVTDALGIGSVSKEVQNRVMKDLFRMADTLDGIAEGDVESLRRLIREQAAVRKTPLSKQAEKILSNETDFTYLYDFARSQLGMIATDFNPRTKGQMISTFQTMAQLMNIRTTKRNLISNQVFDLIATAVNDIALPVDLLLSTVTGTRTVGLEKSWFSKSKREGALQGAKRSFLEASLDVRNKGATNKYGTPINRTWAMASSPKSGKIMSQLEALMAYELTVTDEFHKGSIRAETMESLQKFVDQGGITMDEAIEFAESEALYRAFQDDTYPSMLLRMIHDALNVIGSGDTGKRIGGLKVKSFGLGDLTVKYTQVPGALLSRAIEFSPLGYAKAIYHLADMAIDKGKGNNTNAAQRKAALAFGQATTGTGLILLFTALAKAKLLRRDDDDKNKNAAAAKSSQGLRGTQINLTGLARWINGGSPELQDGDILKDIGFLEPLDGLVTIGVMLSEEDEVSTAKVATNSVEGVYKAIQDTTAMQVISNISNTIRYHDPEQDLPLLFEVAIEWASSAATGFVPSPVRQAAQATDLTYRDQYKTKGVENKIKASIMNALPGLRQRLPEKLTSLGETKVYGDNALLNAYNAMMAAGNVNVYKDNATYAEMDRVYQTTKDGKVWAERNAPYTVSYTVKSGKESVQEEVTLTGDERTAYQALRGRRVTELVQELKSQDWYESSAPEVQAEVLSKVKLIANSEAQQMLAESRGIVWKNSSYEKYEGKEASKVVLYLKKEFYKRSKLTLPAE